MTSRSTLFAAAFLLAACGASGSGTDPKPSTEWRVEPPEEHGLDSEALEVARAWAFQEGLNTQAVIIVRDGVIVAEWYAEGRDKDSWVTSWSIAKSFASSLVGIAISQGFIDSVDQPATDFIPEWAGTDKEDITLKHILEMTTGLDWDETYSDLASDVALLATSSEPLLYAIAQDVSVVPGSLWHYSSGTSMLLSRVIAQTTGMSVSDYARENLFEPLGFSKVEWWQDPQGNALTHCCIDSTPRDFARLGQLYLQGGMWVGERLVSEAWVSDSVTPTKAFSGYGYQWWLDEDPFSELSAPMFAARGLQAQRIFVLPEQDMVIVRFATYRKPTGPAVAPNAELLLNSIRPVMWSDSEFFSMVRDALRD